MKKIFRAGYGDESRVLLILADSCDEAITLANNKVIDDEFGIENYNKEEDESELPFIFDEESVFEVNLNKDSQIIEEFTYESFM